MTPDDSRNSSDAEGAEWKQGLVYWFQGSIAHTDMIILADLFFAIGGYKIVHARPFKKEKEKRRNSTVKYSVFVRRSHVSMFSS